MAAPPSASMKNLTGTWTLNKQLSDDFDPVLNLQGVPWLARKAINFATLTLQMKQYNGDDGITRIDIQQNGTGGIKGTTEPRTLDWSPREHSDHIFGNVKGQSRWLAASDLQHAYLGQGWLEGPEEAGGPNGETHVESMATNEERGWIADQIWGFAIINGERRHVRRVICVKDGKEVTARLVYDYLGA